MATTLIDSERNTISNALYAAARQYDKDAASFSVASEHIGPDERLASQFTSQATECRRLAELLDGSDDIVLSD